MILCAFALRYFFSPVLTNGELKADLAQIERMLEEVHPDPFFQLTRAEFQKKSEAILMKFPTGATQKQFFVETASLVAELGDGHTRITPSTPEYFRFRDAGGLLFPLELSFRGGRASVSKNYGNSGPPIGTEIRSINGVAATRMIREVLPLQSGERLAFRQEEAGQNMRGFGFTLYDWRPPYSVVDHSGKSYSLPGVTIATIRSESPTGAVSGLPGCSFKILPGSIGYLEFASGNDPEKFKSFVEQAFHFFKASKVHALIVDVRSNRGGGQEAGAMVIELFTDKPYRQFGGSDVKVSQVMKDKYGEKEFGMRFGTESWSAKSGTITKTAVDNTVPGPNPLRLKIPTFVLIGPLTFSNGMAFASAVKDCKLATIVGEETGGLGSGFGQFESFTLEKSKLMLWVSVKHIFRPSRVDDGRGILPDVLVVPTEEDRAKHIDKVLEQAILLARNSRA